MTNFPPMNIYVMNTALSRGTVRRAIDMLVEEGRLRREQGRGTFVTAPLLTPIFFRLSSFDEEMHQRGRTPSTKLLQLKVIPASEAVAADLDLRTGEEVIEIIRLRLADSLPMALETRYLAYKICPDLLHEDLGNTVHSQPVDRQIQYPAHPGAPYDRSPRLDSA